MRKWLFFHLVATLFTMSLISCGEGAGSSDDFPSRPVTMIVPWAAGGMTDLSSRALAAVLPKHLGVAVNVVNRTGGGGVIGHLALSQARPDGYTIGAVTVEITMMHNMGHTNLTYQDYTPLSLMVDNAASITVRSDSPFENVQDLIDAIKADPGSIQASGTSRGGIWDLARIGFLSTLGMEDSDMPWVPSQGAAPALQELIAGGVDVVTASLSEVDALRQAGQVKVLAVMAGERLAEFPQVPTLKEQGIDWQLGGWVAVMAPLGLPDEQKAVLVEAIKKTVNDPEFIEALTQAGSNIREIQGVEFMNFLKQEHDKMERSMTTAGLKHGQ